jgi:hypothetical protein
MCLADGVAKFNFAGKCVPKFNLGNEGKIGSEWETIRPSTVCEAGASKTSAFPIRRLGTSGNLGNEGKKARRYKKSDAALWFFSKEISTKSRH